ncbi:MAG: bifunctional pyr operon transcriptional regulator/uracil phosphoribosyltransferase PyrR [Candidatus Sumerlaeia bacterium]
MEKQALMSSEQMDRAIEKMADAIAEVFKDQDKIAIIGIRRHGVTVAKRIRELLKLNIEREIPMGILDITMYRDDLERLERQPIVRSTQIDFDINRCTVVLVDDVLYTGRTIRCALDQIVDYGRPKVVRLAVLVDRGLRELPIHADICGLQVTTNPEQKVEVGFEGHDDQSGIWIISEKSK